MTIETTLYQTLRDDATVGALVLDGTIYQIFKGPPPQGFPSAKPYIILHVIYGEHMATFSGRSTLKHARIQVDCVAETYDQARTLADAVYAAVDGSMAVGAMSESQLYEDDAELHRLILDFSLWE